MDRGEKMKLGYIVALLMIVLMVGCATKEAPPAAPEPTPPAAPETPPAAPEAAPEAPAEEAPAEEAPAEEVVEEEPELTEADMSQIERLKTACERGNAGLCAALKNRYDIDWPPEEPVEEPVAEEPAEVEVAGEEI